MTVTRALKLIDLIIEMKLELQKSLMNFKSLEFDETGIMKNFVLEFSDIMNIDIQMLHKTKKELLDLTSNNFIEN